MKQRTLTRWAGKDGPRKRGRPSHSRFELDQARPRILEVLKVFKFRAGKGTVKILLPDLPLRVINILLRVLKAEHRSEEALFRKKNRIHVRVMAKDVIRVQDSTHVGSANGRRAWAELAKDAATCEAHAFGNGRPLKAEAMLAHLRDLKKKGELSFLVLATDNGSPYKDKRVQEWCRKNEVVQLFSRPHTPQDNGRAERAICEGKYLASLGKGIRLSSAQEGVQALDRALHTLNLFWPRQSRSSLTAEQLKGVLPGWSEKTTRSRFFNAAQLEIESSTAGLKGKALRRETREAIFRTLERFGLILRTRGEIKPQAKIQDRIS